MVVVCPVLMVRRSSTGDVLLGVGSAISASTDVAMMVVTMMVVAVMVVAAPAPAPAPASVVAVVLSRRRRVGGRRGLGMTRLPSPFQDLELQVLLASPAGSQHAALSGDGIDPSRLQGALHTLLLVLLCREAAL